MSEQTIREQSVLFGARRHLAGVVTEPCGPPRGAAVLVTAGLTPKFGPFRLYAQLARRLARDGVRVLRFDLGGIGDSGQAHGGLPLRRRTELELRAAVDRVLETPAGGGLALAGLCSGAEDSFRYAAADPRVTGVAMIDPFAYRTRGWVWRDWLIRGARRALAAAGALPASAPSGSDGASLVDYRHMERAECEALLRALIARGVGLHFVYTGGMRESFNHKGQFRAMFRGVDFGELATVDYFPQLRHTQVLEHDRRLVIESIARRVPERLLACRHKS